MHISGDQIREVGDGFRSITADMLAPHPAVAAFMTIAPDLAPVSFVEWSETGNTGGTRWTVVGAGSGSLAVVTAAASVTWCWQDSHQPEDAQVTARRLPLARMAGVALEEIRANVDRSFDFGELWGYTQWVIELDNGDSIRLNGTEHQGADEDRAAEFCLSLLEQMSKA